MATEAEKRSAKAGIMRDISIFLTVVFVAAEILPQFMGLSITPASRAILGLFALLMLLSWTICWQLKYGWFWTMILTGWLIAFVAFFWGSINSQAKVLLLAFVGLVAVSIWVSGDARKHGMSTVWGFSVFLLPVVFLPVYFWRRAPVGAADNGDLTLLGLEDKTTEAPAAK
jgi:hypothetical protein